jgi:soluble lytic murein transglycosylase-like protein
MEKILVILELIFGAFLKLFMVGFRFFRKNLALAVLVILALIYVTMPKKGEASVEKNKDGTVAMSLEGSPANRMAPVTETRLAEIAKYIEAKRAEMKKMVKVFTFTTPQTINRDGIAAVIDSNKDYAYWLGFAKDNKYNEAFDKALAQYSFLIEAEIGRWPGTRITKELVAAMIAKESRCNPGAIGKKGELGLMQMLPSTAAHYGYDNPQDLKDPAISIYLGVMYLAELEKNLHSLPAALVGYNSGEQGAKDMFVRNPGKGLSTYDYVEGVAAILEVSGRSNRFLL